LENTLKIFGHWIKKGITVRREFAPDVPRVCAYGGELNQVWTNLIDNAIDAMDGNGELFGAHLPRIGYGGGGHRETGRACRRKFSAAFLSRSSRPRAWARAQASDWDRSYELCKNIMGVSI